MSDYNLQQDKANKDFKTKLLDSWPGVIGGLVAIWLLVAPLVLDYVGSNAAFYTDLLTGLFLLINAGSSILSVQAASDDNTSIFRQAHGILNLAIGIWLLAVPFLLDFDNIAGAFTTHMVCGAVLVIATLFDIVFLERPGRKAIPPAGNVRD